MPCIVPFNNNLDISLFVFKPVGIFGEDLIEALKYFSFCSEDHGCAYSSVFKSIHGNMVLWYGAWMKRSKEKKKQLIATLVSALTSLSSMAILVDYDFIEAYGGESKDGHPAAKFSSGDTITMSMTVPNSDDLSNLSYAYLAILKSSFMRMEGASAGVCFRCYDNPYVLSLHVWNSLYSCYSWLLSSNYRETMSPYLDHLSMEIKYDIFQVVYVSRDDTLSFRFFPSPQMIENPEGSEEKRGLESSKGSKLML